MDIKDLKQAEDILIEATNRADIVYLIENELSTWTLEEIDGLVDISIIKNLFHKLQKEIFQDKQNDTVMESLEWIVFDRIHDVLHINFSNEFSNDDAEFFEKCKFLSDINVSAEQFGADENYSIPLTAAIVELSILDHYRNSTAKMKCLCSTFDLVYAELKSAIVSVISQNAEKEIEIPIIDNSEIIPILMIVIIKSKLVHIFSNLAYIKSFYDQSDSKHVEWEIFKSFEKAVDKLIKLDISSLRRPSSKMIRSIDLEGYMKITSYTEEQTISKTLVDEANQRVLDLITQSTSDDQAFL